MEKDQHGKLYHRTDNLKGIVSHFYHVFSTEKDTSVVKHVSPSLEMLLVLNFGTSVEVSFGEAPIPEAFVNDLSIIGPLRKMLNYNVRFGADALVVNFELDGFYRLFNVPLINVSDKAIYNAEELLDGAELRLLWNELLLIKSVQNRIDRISKFILLRARESEKAANPLLNGEKCFYDPLLSPVKAIASDADLTERSIQIRFQKYTGYSPKELMRFLRFKTVINHILQLPAGKVNVFDIITTYNYYDQSHLIKDFNTFLGTTPLKFIENLKGQQFYLTGQDKSEE